MANVTFDYNRKKDAWAWVYIAKDRDESWGINWQNENQHVPDLLMKKILESDELEAIKLVEKHFSESNNQKFKEQIIKAEIKSLEAIWRLKEERFFHILEKITAKPIYQKTFPSYFTTGFMCPYRMEEKPNWFMVSIWKGIPFWITTICHEILHLQFIHYWQREVTRKIGEEKFEILKESLTFLLDEEEFDGIILSEDGGYPNHQKIRSRLSKFWSENNDFHKLIDFGVKILE